MASKIVAIFVILTSWCTVLNASSLDCGGYTEDVSDYGEIMPQLQRKVKQQFSQSDISCAKVAKVGHDKDYCVVLDINKNGRTTKCIVKWGTSASTGSACVCSSNGAAIANGGSINVGSRGGGYAHVRHGNSGHGNDDLGNKIKNDVHRRISEKFSKAFGPGFPFNH